MADFEKLGVFYLGRRADPSPGGEAEPILYDSRDLVTHALMVGMTGSGKTGLGIALIEEAAIDGVPAIVIDPKGDLTNLLLTFPSLAGADFEPWISGEEAERAGKTRAEFAADQASRWRKGLSDWGQDGARIARLRDAADFAIYTPGSTAGRPVSVLGSFGRPSTDDPEVVRERVQTSVSSLLTLAGVNAAAADPMTSREHIFLSALLQAAWDAGQSPDLAGLVQAIQHPPMARIGVIDIDSFFPPKDRFAFAMSLNALLASPGFEVWTRGDPLDIAALLRTKAGKPRVSIFSIAHLDDTQRMFFVAMLLNAVTGWMRAQGGTSSLRALLYMDEIFGFFPPVANPPSKVPLLTLLKQGRAMGLGVVLATQNPVDLDYKGLSNIGTWFLGRLQTDRDKARVLDGLESADVSAGASRAELDRLLTGLTSRVFLMRNVHDEGLTLFQSRWALSYLRGPLGRDEIKRLASRPAEDSTPVAALSGSSATGSAVPEAAGGTRPIVPPDVPQFFAPGAGGGAWQPVIYGAADVSFVDKRLKVDSTRCVAMAAPIGEGAVPVDWKTAEPIELAPEALVGTPPGEATFAALPPAALKGKHYATWNKQFGDWLVATEQIALFRHAASGQTSLPGETERDFRARLQQAAREDRDRQIDALRKKYAPKQAALGEKLRRATQALDREREQSSSQYVQTAISFGATLVGALLGRRAISAGTVGRATTAARGVGRAQKEANDVTRAQETLAAIEADRERLDSDLRSDTDAIEAVTGVATDPLEPVVVKPKRAGVKVKLVALVWK